MPVLPTELHIDICSVREMNLKITIRFSEVQVAEERLSGIR